MSVFVSNNANGRNVSFSSFESSIVDDTQIRTKKKTHQCGGGLNQNNLQNRRNFFAPLRRTKVNARRARSASYVRVEEKRNKNYFAHVSRTSSSPRAHLAFASVRLKNMKKIRLSCTLEQKQNLRLFQGFKPQLTSVSLSDVPILH